MTCWQQTWRKKSYQVKLVEVLESPKWRENLFLEGMGWRQLLIIITKNTFFNYIYILLYFKFCFSFDLFLPCLGIIWFIIYVGTIIIKALKNSDILFIFPFFALLVGLWILIFFFTILIFLYVSTIGLINTWEIGWCNW